MPEQDTIAQTHTKNEIHFLRGPAKPLLHALVHSAPMNRRYNTAGIETVTGEGRARALLGIKFVLLD